MRHFHAMLLHVLFLALAAQAGGALASTTIMVFGDSLSAGYGLPQEAGWVSLLRKKLPAQPSIRLVNASISGETAAGGRARIEQALRTHRPDIVILELGGNDGLRGASLASIHDNLEAIIEACRRADAAVLLTGMRLPPNYGIAYTQKFQDIYARLAARHGLGLVPFLLDGFGDRREFFQADGIHPNAEAQHRIAENVWKVLQTMLVSRPTVADRNG